MDQDLKDSIHDILLDLTGNVPSETIIINAINSIPSWLLSTGREWGYWDTVFREDAYLFLKKFFGE